MGILTLCAAMLLAVVPVSAAAATATSLLAATPQFRHYNIEQGLPGSDVYTVVQGRHGVMWIGTTAGLARFNGTQFKVYRHIPDEASSLASNDVSSILVDSQGRVWAGGEGSGINLYEPATGGFRHFKHQSGRADSLSGNDVMAMANGRHGTLWVGTYGHGLDHMTSPGHFQHIEHVPGDPHSLLSDNILSLYSQGDGTLWIGTDKGLQIREPDGRLRLVRFEGRSKPTAVWGIDGNGHHVRASTSDGLFAVSPDGVAKRLFPHSRLAHFSVLSSVRDHQGDLWVASVHGLFLVRHGRVTYLPPQPLTPGGQPGQIIFDLAVDSEGGLWIATRNAGIAYLSPHWRNFSHYSHRPDDPASLRSSDIHALAVSGQGKLWIGGGMNQLDELDPATGAVTHHGKVLGPKPKGIMSMAPTGQHGLWLGFPKGIGLLEQGHLRMIRTPRRGSYSLIVSNRHGTLYAAAVGAGVYRVDRRSLTMKPLKLAFASKSDRQTTAMLLHDGHLWRASHAGLSRLPAHSDQLVPVAGVAKGEVEAMAISGSTLWLARPDGLAHYHLHDQQATLTRRIGAHAGWPGISCRAMLIDQRGRVWLFAEAGLWRYDPATHRFRHFGKNDGLPNPQFTSRQLVRMGNGTVFAGTLGGVIGFHPAAIDNQPHKPQLAIISIAFQRGDHNITLAPDTRHLHLRWNDHDLRITVHAQSYIDPKRNHYRFFLTGMDSAWVDTGTSGVRELAGLAPGHYQLKVEAAGPSGAWAHLATPLTIDVDAPPWLRPWAWAIYVLVILVIGYLVSLAWRRRLEQRHRVQMAEQQRRMAERASAAKTRFLANLGHEIRTPMTGVLGMAELLLDDTTGPRQRSYVEAIRHSGELLLKLVNDALDLARIEAGRFTLEAATMDPRAVLADVRQLLLGQAMGKGLELTADTDAAVPAHLRGDALRIQQILLNLANNAIKFTRHGGVHLRADWSDGELILNVTDTGPGISEADRERLFQRFEQADSPERDSGSGLGLAICRELVALMGGRITLASKPGQGSRFTVCLPLPAVANAPHIAEPPATAPVTARRVLLVEDDTTVARVIHGLLETRGHHVTHAENSLEALGALERDRFDALLVDLDLPGMDGYQLAGMIRQRETGRHIPIGAITARTGGDEEPRAHAAGMDTFARKPLTGNQLAALIEQLCPTDAEGTLEAKTE